MTQTTTTTTGEHKWELRKTTETQLLFECTNCWRHMSWRRGVLRNPTELTTVATLLPKSPCQARAKPTRGPMTGQISAHIMLSTRPAKTDLGIFTFLALPRVGENIDIGDSASYHVEQVSWSPFPDLPKLFVRKW